MKSNERRDGKCLPPPAGNSSRRPRTRVSQSSHGKKGLCLSDEKCSGHYNSDEEESEDDDNAEFKNFMNEIKASDNPPQASSTSWQELWDPQSGQPYYWNTITNELTWEKPKEMTNPPDKPGTDATKANQKPNAAKNEIRPENIGGKAPTLASLAITRPLSTIHLGATQVPVTSTINGLPVRQEDSRISFKLSLPDKSVKNGDLSSPKINGKVWDADSIIAAIEKEVPPDHKQEKFVPLFKRRVPDADKLKPKLGNDFKSYFRPSAQSIFDYDSESSSPALLTVQSTHKGLGYEEKEGQAEEPEKNQQQLSFVAGETLKPLVPTTPLTLDERIKRLESETGAPESPAEFSKQKVITQLEVLKEAWKKKKLDSSFLDEWLTSVEANLNEQTKETEPQDQVVDMVLEETDSEAEETPRATSPVACAISTAIGPEALDSELSSFYSDLATLDATSQSVSLTTSALATKPDEGGPARVEQQASVEDNSTGDQVKGIKRTKMSSDMSSLVAKWQRINQGNT